MNYSEIFNSVTKDIELRAMLGDEAADKANAILAILQIGEDRSVAYSKAILAAAGMALEKMCTFAKS